MSGESAAGKGDSPRPLSITPEEWARNWRRIFKENKKNTKNAPNKKTK